MHHPRSTAARRIGAATFAVVGILTPSLVAGTAGAVEPCTSADLHVEVVEVEPRTRGVWMHLSVSNVGDCTAASVTFPVPDLGPHSFLGLAWYGDDPAAVTGPGVESQMVSLSHFAPGEERRIDVAVDVAVGHVPRAAFFAFDDEVHDPTPDDAIILMEGTLTPATSYFGDVPDSSPFTYDISWVDHHDVTDGYADGYFHPTAPVSRQAVAAMLWRLRGRPQGPFADPLLPPPFADVGHDHQFATAINWASWAELTGGYADGGFHPTATVTRQSLVSMLWRLAGSPTGAPDPVYTDVAAGHPFHDAIAWATDAGIVSGFADGGFHPGATVSRQAAAAWITHWYAAVG